MSEATAEPYLYWVGMNTTTDDPAELAEYHKFYWIHLDEVVDKNPGFVSGSRYALAGQDRSWPIGPTWLAAYGIEDEDGAQGYLDRHDGLRGGRFQDFTPTPEVWRTSTAWVWQLMWRRVATDGAGTPPASSISLVAFGPKEKGETGAVPSPGDVLAIGAASKCVRTSCFEVMRSIRYPAALPPRYLGVFEGDGEVDPISGPAVGDLLVQWNLSYHLMSVEDEA